MSQSSYISGNLSSSIYPPSSERIPTSKGIAKGRFLNRDIVSEKAIEELSIVHLAQKDLSNPTTLKSSAIWMQVMIWIGNTPPAVWGIKNCLKVVCSLMTLGSHTQSQKKSIKEGLNELTGSICLAKLIEIGSPVLTKFIQEQLKHIGMHKSIQDLLIEENITLQRFIEQILSIMYLNIAKSIQDSSENVELKSSKKPVKLADVLACLCQIVNIHLPSINARSEIIDKIPDIKKRDRKLRQLFAPLVEEFLGIAFPKEMYDIPLTKFPLISRSIWIAFKKKHIPDLFIEIYRQFSLPLNKEKKEFLNKIQGGESLVLLAELAGQKGGELLPSILLNDQSTSSASVASTQIIEGLLGCLKASDGLKKIIGEWLSSELVNLGKSTDTEIKQLWCLLGGYLEPLLLHVFYHLSNAPQAHKNLKGRIPDALGVILIQFLSVGSVFFNSNKKTIDERIMVLKSTFEVIHEDKILIEIFSNFSNDILSMMGIKSSGDLSIPNFVKKPTYKQLREFLPKFLLKQYLIFTNTEIDDSFLRKKLRSLMFDPKNLDKATVTNKVVKGLHEKGEGCSSTMFEDFYQKLWEESGTDYLVKALEGMCTVISGDLVDAFFAQMGVSAQNFLNEKNNIFMQDVNKYIKCLGKTIVLEILTNIINTTVEKNSLGTDHHPKQLLVFNVLLRISDFIDKDMKNIDVKIQEANEFKNDSKHYFQEIQRAFSHLAADLHSLGGNNPLVHLPLEGFSEPQYIKDILWVVVKETLLPSALSLMHSELTSWQQQLELSYHDLETCFRTSHPYWTCQVLAQYISDYLKNYLLTSNEDAAKLVLDSLEQYFASSQDLNGEKVNKVLQENSLEIQKLLSQNIKNIGLSEDPPILQFWPMITKYVEAFTAKFFAELSKTIHEIETENPDFMIDIAIMMLKDTAEYFEVINRVTAANGEAHGYRVSPTTMLAAFGSRLHDGVPLEPSATNEEKDKVRLEGFFVPLASKLLDLANLSINDFPLPSAFKQLFGELLTEKLLPLGLLRADQIALEHHVRDALMLNFVQTLYVALNGVELTPTEDLPEEYEIKQDLKQKRLNETCGALVLGLVKLIPDTMVQYVFMKEKVKNMSAEAIGKTMMPYLSRWTLLQLIDMVLYSGLPNFHPSKWEGKVGREVLIPRRAFIRPDGKMELKPVKKFKFAFTKSTSELAIQQEKNFEESMKTRKQLRDGFTRTISSQLSVKVWSFIKSLWENLQAHLDDFIEGQFPGRGPQIKALMDKIGHRIFFDIIGTIFQFLSAPFIKLIEFLVEKIYIDKRSDDIIENLHSATIENLFYKWLDTVLDTLVRLRKTKRDETAFNP